jgi:hypothetical protein
VVADSSEGEVVGGANITTSISRLSIGQDYADFSEVAGKQFQLYVRMNEDGVGANLQLASGYAIGDFVDGDFKAVTSDSTYRGYLLGAVKLPDAKTLGNLSPKQLDDSINPRLLLKRTSGSGLVNIDYFTMFFDPTLRLISSIALTADYDIRVRGQNIILLLVSTDAASYTIPWTGQIIEMEPDRINHLFLLFGDDQAANDISRTFTYREMNVTPRWALL